MMLPLLGPRNHRAVGIGIVIGRVETTAKTAKRFVTMFTLHATKKLQKHLNLTPDESRPDPTTRLGKWYGNVAEVGDRQVLIFMSERTFLTVLLPAEEVDAGWKDELAAAVDRVLERMKIPKRKRRKEADAMGEVAITGTESRRVLGLMNSTVENLRWVSNHEGAVDLERKTIGLATAPMLVTEPDVTVPVDLARRAFGRKPDRRLIWELGWADLAGS